MATSVVNLTLPQDRMPEAEVSLRLAFSLLSHTGSEGAAKVAIDGAQIRVHGAVVFPITAFLDTMGWKQVEQRGKNGWQGDYQCGRQRLEIHARSGMGDVVVRFGGRRIRVECKGGPLIEKPGSQEYRILRQALGQMLTVEDVGPNDILAVAVPLTVRFEKLATQWRDRPLLSRSGIQILLVGRDGAIEGLDL